MVGYIDAHMVKNLSGWIFFGLDLIYVVLVFVVSLFENTDLASYIQKVENNNLFCPFSALSEKQNMSRHEKSFFLAWMGQICQL